MTKAVQKITLSPSSDIPFDKLMLSQSNVRRIKTGVSIEELVEDIARRWLPVPSVVLAGEAERLQNGSGWLPEVLRRVDLVAHDGEDRAEGQGGCIYWSV